MVQCSMSVYVLSDRHGHNDPKIVFSTVPKKSKQRVHRGKDGEDNNKKNSMKSCQNEAWLSSINHGHVNGCTKCSNNARFRTCLHHFHPSVITCDSKDRHRLKIGAHPTMHLSQHTVENELRKNT